MGYSISLRLIISYISIELFQNSKHLIRLTPGRFFFLAFLFLFENLFGGIKVAFYLSAMKNIKINERVHAEVKNFVSTRPEWDMSTLASHAILKYLKDSGHKFVHPHSKKTTSK